MARIMQRTVFVDHDGERVRLTRGDEAPGWYEGDLAADELATVRDTIPGTVGNHPALQEDADEPTEAGETPTEPPAGGGGELSPEDQAALDALSDDDRAALEALNDDQRSELATMAAETQPELTDEQLLDGSVDDVLARVGDDVELARRALVAETGQEKPRSTLTSELTKRAAQ